MGLILLPLLLFWLAAIGFSIRMGYVLLSGASVFPTVLTSVVAALLLTVLYVYAVYWRFKGAKELWAFQIHFSFLTNKVSILLFLAAVLVYFYGQAYWDIVYVRASMFSVAFAVSTAAVVGVFTADAFMDKYQIKKTH